MVSVCGILLIIFSLISLVYTVESAKCHSLTQRQDHICYRRTLMEFLTQVAPSKSHNHNFGKDTLFCDAFNTVALPSWRFSQNQLLASTFPIDSFGNVIRRNIPSVIFSRVYPTPLKTEPMIGAYSEDALINILDINPDHFAHDKFFLDMSSGNVVHDGHPCPLAHRYGGHQFGYWAEQLGDGRAHMLGEYVNSKGERWELQLKGSGRTPYSRSGDGRAVIRSSVREFLCSEAMHFLGIPTSRAVSIVHSEDTVVRDQFYNGNLKPEKAAVVLRLAKSWFRLGSLEILSKNSEISELKLLVDFVIENYFPRIDNNSPDRLLSFFSEVVSSTAKLIALWQSVGFAHGVMNTDNFSILSITIDYGPFGFMDHYDPYLIPNTSDDEGMYMFKNQPQVAKFNLEKLSEALAPLLTPDQQRQTKMILNYFLNAFKFEYLTIMRQKLGLKDSESSDESLIDFFLSILEAAGGDFTSSFRQLSEWSLSDMKTYSLDPEMWALLEISKNNNFYKWVSLYTSRLERMDNFDDHTRLKNMQQINPRYILRNWIAQKAIELAEKGNYELVKTVHDILKEPYKAHQIAEQAGFAGKPPNWSKALRVSCSS